MKCKACNRTLTIFEEKMKRSDGSQEDLCTICRKTIREDMNLDDADYTITDWEFPEEYMPDIFFPENDDD